MSEIPDIISCPVCGKGTLTHKEYIDSRGIEGKILKTKWRMGYARTQDNGWIYRDYIGKKIIKVHGVVKSTKLGEYVHDGNAYGLTFDLVLQTGGVGWELWRWEDIIEFAMRANRKDLTDLKGTPIFAYFLDTGEGKDTWGKSMIGIEVNENLVL